MCLCEHISSYKNSTVTAKAKVLRHGSPTYDPWPGTGPWPFSHWALGITGKPPTHGSTTIRSPICLCAGTLAPLPESCRCQRPTCVCVWMPTAHLCMQAGARVCLPWARMAHLCQHYACAHLCPFPCCFLSFRASKPERLESSVLREKEAWSEHI